ncbi:unnamed protein product [Staurois parvus]|uniref:Uncharacterized protein n=1 Tax=Staurois parvus TaxID=386267 RepID=A0ABN9AV15_9NEOB|nr:unnamed protein product [Staurois parvus]
MDSEDEEMGMDWLWLSQMLESAIPPSPATVIDTGILRPEAPEFVPQSPPIEELEDSQSSLPTTDSADIPSFIEEEVRDEAKIQGEERPVCLQPQSLKNSESVGLFTCQRG